MTGTDREQVCRDALDSLAQLEFLKVVERLAGHTQTPYGRQKVESLTPSTDLAIIRQALAEGEQLRRVLEEVGPLPIGSGEDLLPGLTRLQTEGVRLDAVELREVQYAIEAAIACRQQLRDEERCPALLQYGASLVPLPDLAADLRRSIGPGGELLDTASFELGDLRQELQRGRARVKRQLDKILGDDNLQGVFQESLITDRNGRYVLPVRTDHSGRLKGFVHDVSASGQTLYLEPEAALEGNNRVQTLLREIQREEERILARLSTAVRNVREDLEGNQAILAHLDLRQAIARLAVELDAVVPELSETPMLSLLAARHPLLLLNRPLAERGATEVAPVDVRLAEEQSVLIVSGPNTGGKTVALKTAGLLVLMARAGLPVPCAPGSRLYPFAPVLADIGDEQSIEQSLSTFSGHLLRLKHILEQAGSKALIVLDELGTGTDPGEGAALALATLDLLQQAGARVMATTHLHLIKGYAQLEEGVENAAVEFDAETLQPTYRLHYGIPGASHAFTIAERLGLPAALLDKASAYLGHDERKGLAIVERLQSLRVALEEELSSAGELRQEAKAERDQRRKMRQDLETRRQEILDQTREEGSRLLADAEKRLRELFRDLDPQQAKPKDRARVTEAVRSLKQELPAAMPGGPEQVPDEVALGEKLFVPSLGVDLEVVKIDGQNVELDAGGKRVRQKLKALRQYQPRRFVTRGKPQARVRDRVERQAFRPRLVLVGKRVDEAQGLLERFLDEALLHSEARIEVVHGAGQGILRRAVRELLAERPEVASFQSAGVAEGGDNITVVELQC